LCTLHRLLNAYGGLTLAEQYGVSETRGFLAKQLYVFFTAPTRGIGPLWNLQVHLDYQEELEKRGILFAARPALDGRRASGIAKTKDPVLDWIHRGDRTAV
jgi:hypothetical protein